MKRCPFWIRSRVTESICLDDNRYITHVYIILYVYVYLCTYYLYVYVFMCMYTLATVAKGDQKAPFSITTTLRCRGGHYSFPWIDPLYPWYVPNISEH